MQHPDPRRPLVRSTVIPAGIILGSAISLSMYLSTNIINTGHIIQPATILVGLSMIWLARACIGVLDKHWLRFIFIPIFIGGCVILLLGLVSLLYSA